LEPRKAFASLILFFGETLRVAGKPLNWVISIRSSEIRSGFVYLRKWTLLSIMIGAVAGLATLALVNGIGFFMSIFLAPEARGVGTDAAIGAFHRSSGLIRLRAPFVKLLTSAITIGSGGTSGREGPIAQMGAGIGSQIANLFKLSEHERRIAFAAGHGAGIAVGEGSELGVKAIGTFSTYLSQMSSQRQWARWDLRCVEVHRMI